MQRLLAHGDVPPPPTWPGVLFEWPFEPLVWVACALALWLYLSGTRRVPSWPAARRASFVAGVGVLAVALAGPVAVYARALFSVHMVQHLLLTFVVAPLIVLGTPLALAARTPLRTRSARLVHSRPVRAVTHPIVAWCLFTLVMWLTHFSPLYDAALESEVLHVVEHALFGAAGLLFWWPLVGLDPGAAGRLGHPMRLLYLLVALPQQSFLGLAVYSAGEVLYPHYESLRRGWGPAPLADQALAGVLMWVIGDVLFIVALVFAVLAWMRHDEREARRIDRRLGLG
ncbi:MAG: cytochrome c oxidase assembly protein [Actinomycetota bacterium]